MRKELDAYHVAHDKLSAKSNIASIYPDLSTSISLDITIHVIGSMTLIYSKLNSSF